MTEASNEVKVMPSGRIKVIPFAVSLPPNALQAFDEPAPRTRSELITGDSGVVGTITVLKSSAMIWFGWGKLDNRPSSTAVSGTVGKGVPNMGQLVAAMPRTKYQGAFSGGSIEASCSQLVGGDSDDQVLASQIASRLSRRLGRPVFVSCQLHNTESQEWMTGLDRDTITQHAAALAERKIWLLLNKEFEDTK
jgi:hypothetical protein